MRSDERDPGCLWDMLDAARCIREITTGIEFYQYIRNRPLQWSLERGYEIIGEAARRVSETFRAKHPEIPWRRIISQRNVIAHEYGEIKQEVLWQVAKENIPELIAFLEAVDIIKPPECS